MIMPTGLRLYIYLGVAAAFLAVLTFAGCEHSNASAARSKRDQWQAAATTALDANKSNQTAIKFLKEAVVTWKALATPAAQMKVAAERAAELEQENNRLNQALAKRAELDYAKPECNALLDTDFERVCPGVAAGLRDRAGRYENRVRGSPSASRGEDRPIFD